MDIILLHTLRALETSATHHSSGDWQHGRKTALSGAQELPEECSTTTGLGTAKAGDSNYDGALWCSHCGARARRYCKCGPIADSE